MKKKRESSRDDNDEWLLRRNVENLRLVEHKPKHS